MIRPLALAAALTLAGTAVAAGCDGIPAPCRVAGGEYQIALPQTGAADMPVVLFLHGVGGNGANVLRNQRLATPILARGYALIAPTGTRREGSRFGPGWVFYPGWQGRDERAFLSRVTADAARRFGTSPDRVLLAGFSAGAFMVNYLACDAPDSFAAYAPVSGGFWNPLPAACKGPVKLFHTHGWRDSTVPIEGRSLGGGRFQQGDIFAGLEIWRHANACIDEKPAGYSETGPFWRRKWTRCAPGSALELALFPGGHTVPAGWADMVLDWFEQVTAR